MSVAGDAAALLIDAYRNRRKIDRLPLSCRPLGVAEAYAIQDAITQALGPIGGWKVGISGPGAEPRCAPVYRDRLFGTGAVLSARHPAELALEIEFAFRLRCDLPPKPGGYGDDEIAEAVDFVPLIEAVSSRYVDPIAASEAEQLADANGNAAFIVGETVAAWRQLDFRRERVSLAIDGAVVQSALGSHPLGDPLPLLRWLADHAAMRSGGLKSGDIVTTGSLQGATKIAVDSKAVGDWGRWGQVAVNIAG